MSLDGGDVADPAKQAAGDARRAAGPSGNLQRPVLGKRHLEPLRLVGEDHGKLVAAIELQPHLDPEPVAKRRRQETGAGRRPDKGEGRQIDPHRARRRPLADNQVELEILHRRIENLLDGRIEPVDLVDEQHVPRAQVRQQRRQVAGPRDDRPGRRPEADAEFRRHDLRQRRLAEPRRPVEKRMVHRLAAVGGGGDEGLEIGPAAALADEFGKPQRPQRIVGAFRRFAADQPVVLLRHLAPHFLKRGGDQPGKVAVIRAAGPRPLQRGVRLGAPIPQIDERRHRVRAGPVVAGRGRA